MRFCHSIIAAMAAAALCSAKPISQDGNTIPDSWWPPKESDEPIPGTFVPDPTYESDENEVECEWRGVWMNVEDLGVGIASFCWDVHKYVIPHQDKICHRIDGYKLRDGTKGAFQGTITNNNAEYSYVVSRQHCIGMMTKFILPKCHDSNGDSQGGDVWDNEYNLIFRADPNALDTAICADD
ncbi:hypothetical protein K431DRAFT_291756 [Polychaeton citri CBS 116435]|uniref:Uncharacterized protein n=1 Tax=Polychaeton citri CBS 116435 TaxID=1314669 RepID=A0A9P4QE81_9PEZI|nr:hypothetical protein K431DRAFT_291756 [Polychaeton citri CBS 116435]